MVLYFIVLCVFRMAGRVPFRGPTRLLSRIAFVIFTGILSVYVMCFVSGLHNARSVMPRPGRGHKHPVWYVLECSVTVPISLSALRHHNILSIRLSLMVKCCSAGSNKILDRQEWFWYYNRRETVFEHSVVCRATCVANESYTM